MNIGENVRKIRTKKNITQAELARKVNISQAMLCQIERGTKSLSLLLARDIAEVLGCDVKDLLVSA